MGSDCVTTHTCTCTCTCLVYMWVCLNTIQLFQKLTLPSYRCVYESNVGHMCLHVVQVLAIFFLKCTYIIIMPTTTSCPSSSVMKSTAREPILSSSRWWVVMDSSVVAVHGTGQWDGWDRAGQGRMEVESCVCTCLYT